MSQRDGKMYLALRLVSESRTTLGERIILKDAECAGCMFVFWTKTAARKIYGRNVELREIEASKK